ncbi:hypothetical protein [Knoellia sp. LjRoot47]|uniref:hypothetical protein n=1 Tax=Knoellia sp. LjRoot47 TaxID=3342330 RepID=UPI003ECEF466
MTHENTHAVDAGSNANTFTRLAPHPTDGPSARALAAGCVILAGIAFAILNTLGPTLPDHVTGPKPLPLPSSLVYDTPGQTAP